MCEVEDIAVENLLATAAVYLNLQHTNLPFEALAL
jgi:hypothetical protein